MPATLDRSAPAGARPAGRLRGAVGWLRGPGRRRQWRRRVVRRGLAVVCAVAAAAALVGIARSADPRPMERVVVAVRPLAVGEIATPAALREVWWPADLVPEASVHDLGAVLGRPLSVPLGRGEPLTRTRVTRGGLLLGQPVDMVAVHVSVPDPGALAMVSAGDRVDLWGPDGLVARSVLVLSVDNSWTTDFGAVIQGQGSSSGYDVDGGGMVVSAGHEVVGRILSVPDDALGRTQLAVVLTRDRPRVG
ncbi:SAF domain-containing protein [Pedococcus sp. P5_B7]